MRRHNVQVINTFSAYHVRGIRYNVPVIRVKVKSNPHDVCLGATLTYNMMSPMVAHYNYTHTVDD